MVSTGLAGFIGGVIAAVVVVSISRTRIGARPTIVEDVLERYTSAEEQTANHRALVSGIEVLYGGITGVVIGVGGMMFPETDTVLMWSAIGVIAGVTLLIISNKLWINTILNGDEVSDMPLRGAALHVLHGVIVGVAIGVLVL
jgi:Na+/proline symporter